MIYTASEVFRTAHKYVPKNDGVSFGNGKKHGINEICRICKSDAEQLHGEELRPWKEFYKTKEYSAYRCNACGYMFSWYKD